jgi:hypothetical protein
VRGTTLFRALAAASGHPEANIDPKSVSAWAWTPVSNDEFVVALGCTFPPDRPKASRACALVIGRSAGDAGASEALASVATGRDPAEVVRNGAARTLRMRALDIRGAYIHDVTYAFGRVDIGEAKRP